MAKGGIKIKELARELGVTPRKLLERCRGAGIAAQNSASKLTLREAERIRSAFSSGDGTASSHEAGDRADSEARR